MKGLLDAGAAVDQAGVNLFACVLRKLWFSLLVWGVLVGETFETSSHSALGNCDVLYPPRDLDIFASIAAVACTFQANGNTPMFVASQWGCVEVVKVLLEAGADVNQPGVRVRSSCTSSLLISFLLRLLCVLIILPSEAQA